MIYTPVCTGVFYILSKVYFTNCCLLFLKEKIGPTPSMVLHPPVVYTKYEYFKHQYFLARAFPLCNLGIDNFDSKQIPKFLKCVIVKIFIIDLFLILLLLILVNNM